MFGAIESSRMGRETNSPGTELRAGGLIGLEKALDAKFDHWNGYWKGKNCYDCGMRAFLPGSLVDMNR